ncbi:hypothetical protein [Pendulispora albinea]|uniref:Uncharacterized protein n=1 Tax=Pendulispora albinea TaxID=2741071 RepID=A0ABZ2LY20_9BACT
MANRHSHKKLRAEVRARMRETGESYQTAHRRIVAAAEWRQAKRHQPGAVDLVPFTFFGTPAFLSVTDATFVQVLTVMQHTPPSARTWMPPRTAWLRPRGKN